MCVYFTSLKIMEYFILLWLILVSLVVMRSRGSDVNFDVGYDIEWGNYHVVSLNQGKEIQLSMDQSCGAGFVSKQSYESGFFQMRIKLPGGDTAGVITTFYLISNTSNHDELDFEFLGNKEGKPYLLQTNVYANGLGNREQRFHLWFDPTIDFHSYKIPWNQFHVVFYVDDIPIRVFKNNTIKGVNYPTQAMKIRASLWNGEWATNGGKARTNWSFSPFEANYQGFDIDACPSYNINTRLEEGNEVINNCYSSDKNYWWNNMLYWKLNTNQEKVYDEVRAKCLVYDYCLDTKRFPNLPLECINPLISVKLELLT